MPFTKGSRLALAVLATLAAAAGGASASDEDALVRAGRALFRGDVPFLQAATLEGVALPSAACAQCHGPRGAARREAGIAVPSIQWRSLMTPSDARPAFHDGEAVLAAVERGVAAGRPLRPPMPRFSLTKAEQRALIAYLRVLATDAEPVSGVTPGSVVIASVLPLSGPQAAAGASIGAAMAARFDAVNASGGVFGRRIELRLIDGGRDSASASRAALEALRAPGNAPFAFVGSLLPEPDAALRAALRTDDVPMAATLGIPLADSSLPQLTFLLPGITAQVRALGAELGRRCGGGEGAVLVVRPRGAALRDALAPLEGDAAWQLLDDASALDAARREAPRAPVIALVGADAVSFVRDAMTAGAPCLGTLAVVSGRMPAAPTSNLREVLAMPMPPVLESASGAAGEGLWVLLGDAAASVFAEALARSGRGLDAVRFRQALATLHHFETGNGLILSFGPERRHGADAAFLWRENRHASTSP